MLKRIVFSLVLFFVLFPASINASVPPLAKIGDKYFESLEEAIANANSNDTIVLISDVVLDDTLLIEKVVNLDLNGNDISAKEKVFLVKGGFLNVSGKGTIKEIEPNYGAIMLIGSNEDTNEKYSVVNVEEDVTLEGWSGIFINHESSKSYGVVVYLDGKINAVDDVKGDSGVGVYVNGNIKDQNSHPVVNISDDAEIKSTGTGLYIAGYSTFNIGKAYIEGVESGIGIKSGVLNVDGATIIATGKDKTPTEGYNNGIKASGTAIQVESNNGYAGKIQLNISNGNFKSKNSNVIYEYIGKGNNSLIYSMSISGGTFVSEANKDVFSFSDSFKDIHSGFISGGEYSSNPSSYLKTGYTTNLKDNLYSVTKSTMKSVNSNSVNSGKSNSIYKGLITVICLIVSVILIYFNKSKISILLSNLKSKFQK